MNSDDLCYLSIDSAGRLIEKRQVSPVELTKAYLDRIERLDNYLHCYVTVTAEVALEEAKRAESEVIRGRPKGRLHGIPIALKDLFDTQGVATTGGSQVFKNRVPAEDATVVTRLKNASAILLGKVNMSELAMTGPPALGEPVRNPWNLDHIPGGSSSGSGAAVSAGLCAGALGSDTGGSIRHPAAHCGIVGLKPSYGLISRYHVMPLSWSLDHVGPMTRTVEDAAILLTYCAGFDPKDSTTLAVETPNYRDLLSSNLGEVRVGILRNFFERFGHEYDMEVLNAVSQALRELEKAGCKLIDVNIPSLPFATVAGGIIYLSEAFAYYRSVLNLHWQDLGPIFRRYVASGALFTGPDYVQAQRLRGRLRREVRDVFQLVDVLVMPATAHPAVPFAKFDTLHIANFEGSSTSDAWNLVGAPAISVPCAFSSQGIPIGLQIVGRPQDDLTVLNVAYGYQGINPLYKKHPNL